MISFLSVDKLLSNIRDIIFIQNINAIKTVFNSTVHEFITDIFVFR